ncbi:MAG: hypothetical protein JO199_10030 [Candidatus Eremiobacteraeota bacterium]|nr:hypothetical protein [Candidatus Eremiobacteraeota bacterium]
MLLRSLTVWCGLVLAIAGCSQSRGYFGPVTPPASSHAVVVPQATGSPDAAAIAAMSAAGGVFATYGDENASEPASIPKGGKGACHNGQEFFAPDKAGTKNSTENIEFFDLGCAHVVRDAIRVWVPGQPGSETVTRTVTVYGRGGTTPTSTRNETTSYSNATFTTYGFPIVAAGFDRQTSSNLAIGIDKKNIIAQSETVMLASNGAVNDYCTDSAGFNSIGIKRLDATFGWEGGAFSSAYRTLNADGSVSWIATHTGSGETAPIGGFSIATGASNTVCPITTPAYTLQGGTSRGQYTIPVSVTYDQGVIRSLSITNATLAAGNTLNVSSKAGVPPGSLNFINGTLSNATGALATFSVNAFGTGMLTVVKTGTVYQIEGWNVIR